jgi:organic radical activating enzyme
VYESNISTEKNWVYCIRDWCGCGADMAVPKASNLDLINQHFPNSIIIEKELNTKHDRVDPVVVYSNTNNLFKFISWEIGRRCNFDCWYCPPTVHNNYEKQKTLSQFETAYNNLKHWIDGEKTKFSFTGGEPTVYKDYLPFVKRIKQDGHLVMTTTNGSHNENYYRELAEYSDICFSVHLNYVKQFGIDKFIKSIQSATDVRRKNSNDGSLGDPNWVGVRIMCDPGNLDIAKEIYKICKEKFNDIIISVDTVHDAHTGSGNLYSYTEEEIHWIKSV